MDSNTQQNKETQESQEYTLIVGKNISLSQLLMLFTQNPKHKVSLQGKQTIIVE
jgi:hypothetical protein